ncbi:hypothetical protein RY831_23810 [Noviherbaspirillum sp. CPCC 100848]|jgi:hypothetical protein|uniref:Uncharacterized protein n=1 Tax=Noviherbaspirillum album TaxID=3080276 RepID=A0ABU6JEV0_9BURK|nr:hypothetical protein [Noviherbaspirillum sp. CPCC 100848]MEC4722195.1 hypothetical protein [Noviherbaspirillum sp. CPCC 100848]
MKIALSLIALAMSISLTGCGEQTIELVGYHTSVARPAASIIVRGDKGVLTVENSPLNHFPEAGKQWELDTVKMPGRLEQLAPAYQSATMRIAHLKTELQFVGAAGYLLCLPCSSIGLPTEWHFASKKT